MEEQERQPQRRRQGERGGGREGDRRREGGERRREGGGAHIVGEREQRRRHEDERAGNQGALMQTVLMALIMYMSVQSFTTQFKKQPAKGSHNPLSEADERGLNAQGLPVPNEPPWTGSRGRAATDPGNEAQPSLSSLFLLDGSAIPVFSEYDAHGRRLALHRCTFAPSEKMDLHVFISRNDTFDDFDNTEALLWEERGLTFDMEPTNERHQLVNISDWAVGHLARNGSLWAHVYVSGQGVSIDPSKVGFQPRKVTHFSVQMNKYRKIAANKVRKSLLGDKDKEKGGGTTISTTITTTATSTGDGGEGGEGGGGGGKHDESKAVGEQIKNYWKPTLRLQILDMQLDFQRNKIPAPFAGFIRFHGATGDYHPIINADEFWLQAKDLVAVNETVTYLPVELSWGGVGYIKWVLMAQLQKQWEAQETMGFQSEGQNDVFKEMLANTSPMLLALTFIVSTLHTVFDMLAFKNDVSFWKNKRSLEGLSVRSMAVNSFFQLVILLYLADNETSWMVLLSSGVGVPIELWKMGKVFKASLDWGGTDGDGAPKYWIPRMKLTARGGYEKNNTKEFDKIATTHLLYMVLPLVFGYAAYSLVHQQHKGWYSWIVNSLVGFVYAFGFVMMTPQLFINYKLKSVAHMPWKVMVYKSLNTFIDDLFSFIIKMPLMHRIACFRDDIIFFFYLYQRYAYPVDKSRVNEFGQTGEDPPKEEAATAQLSFSGDDDDHRGGDSHISENDHDAHAGSGSGVAASSSTTSGAPDCDELSSYSGGGGGGGVSRSNGVGQVIDGRQSKRNVYTPLSHDID